MSVRTGGAPASPASTTSARPAPDRPSWDDSLRSVAKGFRRSPVKDSIAVVLGLGFGLSPFFLGYYSDPVWSTIGLGVVVATAALLAVRRLPLPSAPALVAVGALTGLALLTLASALWSPSPDGAFVSACRVLLYTALVLLTLRLVRRARRRALLLAALGTGLAIVALVTVIRLLGPGASSLFLAGRLSAPLGYAGGTGCAFVLGTWLCLGLAVRPRPLEAGAGAFGAVLMLCLAVLAQSRSGVPAMLLGAAAVLVVHASARAVWAMLAVAAGAAAGFPVLSQVYGHPQGLVTASDAHAAGLAAIAAAIGVGIIWAVGTAVTDRLRAEGRAPVLRRASRTGLGVLAALTIVALVAGAGPISRRARTQWRNFTQLSVVSPEQLQGESRLLQGGGPLREYWRVSLDTAADHPVAGIGAGGWPRAWFQERRYYDQVWQPNSLVLGPAAELGGLGLLLVAAFLGATAVAAWRIRRRRAEPLSPSMVAAVGVAAAALSYALTDWMWVGLPGVMGMGLLAVGAVLAASARPNQEARQARRTRMHVRVWRIAQLAVLALAAVLLLRLDAASALRDSAIRGLVTHPKDAVDKADTSLRIDSSSVQTYYVKAAALARLGLADQSRAALVHALHREPDNYVTLALLGDLDLRRGDLARAKSEYERAARLDPLDANSAHGIPGDLAEAAQLVGPRPTNVARRRNVVGYQIIKDTSPLELARALGAPGLRASDQVVVGLFGYGIE